MAHRHVTPMPRPVSRRQKSCPRFSHRSSCQSGRREPCLPGATRERARSGTESSPCAPAGYAIGRPWAFGQGGTVSLGLWFPKSMDFTDSESSLRRKFLRTDVRDSVQFDAELRCRCTKIARGQGLIQRLGGGFGASLEPDQSPVPLLAFLPGRWPDPLLSPFQWTLQTPSR
jgi:hypothetical protein